MPEIWFPHLGIEINHLNRVAFTIFGKEVYWYGIFIGTAVLLGLLLAMHEAKRTGQDPDTYLDFALYALVFAIICARLYYVAFSWDNYKDNLIKIFATREGGLAIYGGVIGGVLTALVYSKIKKINFWQLADTAAPSLVLGQVLGRWGNFFNREAFGDFTNNLFAMRYQLSQVRLGDISDNTLSQLQMVNGVEYIQVHPTFLYESLWNLGVAGLYFLGYGLGRVWIEGLRTDQLRWGGFAVSQVLSAIFIVAAAAFLVWKGRREKLVPKSMEGENSVENEEKQED